MDICLDILGLVCLNAKILSLIRLTLCASNSRSISQWCLEFIKDDLLNTERIWFADLLPNR